MRKHKRYKEARLIPGNLHDVQRLDHGFLEGVSLKLKEAGFEYVNDYKLAEGNTESIHDKKEEQGWYRRTFVHKELATSANIFFAILKGADGNLIYHKSLSLRTNFKSGLSVCSDTQTQPIVLEEPHTVYLICKSLDKMDHN